MPTLDDIAHTLSSTQTKPNKIMKEDILPFLQENCVSKVLDFGCGKYLRDSLLLAKNGFVVDAVDLEEQISEIDSKKSAQVNSLSTKIPSKKYDAALVNFVIQVLPTEEQRQKILKSVYSALKDGRFYVLSVRNRKDVRHYVAKTGIPFADGYLMKKGQQHTFVRSYSLKEVEQIMNSQGLDILQIYSSWGAYVALGQK